MDQALFTATPNKVMHLTLIITVVIITASKMTHLAKNINFKSHAINISFYRTWFKRQDCSGT